MKSKSNLKQKLLRAAAGGALIAGLLPVSNAFAVSAFPTSGSCAMLVTQPQPVAAAAPVTASYNVIALVTFTSATAGTISYHGVRVTYTATGYQVAAAAAGDSGNNLPITVAPLAGAPAGVMSITFTPTGAATPMSIVATAVNNGATILMQGQSDAFSGVCQF